MAISAGVDKSAAVEKYNPGAWAKIEKAVDNINIMAYDFHGAWK